MRGSRYTTLQPVGKTFRGKPQDDNRMLTRVQVPLPEGGTNQSTVHPVKAGTGRRRADRRHTN